MTPPYRHQLLCSQNAQVLPGTNVPGRNLLLPDLTDLRTALHLRAPKSCKLKVQLRLFPNWKTRNCQPYL